MSLKLQIISLIISFIYGIFFNILLNLNYKIIYNEKRIIQIFGTGVFIIINSLLYFLILLKVNNGVVHIYCLLSLLLGYVLKDKKLIKKIIKKV